MYVILVYDVEQERVAKVCKFLRRYLHWVQNSVFEGEITEAKLERVKSGLGKLIDSETDSVYLYQARDEKWIDKEILGQERNPTDTLI
ncbi:MAG: CRISPR-associated endonuclease Cas2 [Candidatus Fraserbacteria bacterium RBG_16_55_9]|uniref:CRISPR-associated endoribonuclease Cas2 n=1 Tax=Fraserbacteria sp. (strain RBG_16_55_9) TaxID=1817864 RepID=A0A1F5UUQ5_FRAXR|nr:MAG: CRISPR-associated endonuclease Cas2 [Candidatus Fraserbacteria bacterium RBG_16_55_9]